MFDIGLSKKETLFSVWALLNLFWWAACVGLKDSVGIDVFPWFSGAEEFVLNATVFVVGSVMLYVLTAEEDEILGGAEAGQDE